MKTKTTAKVTTHQIADWLRRGLTAKDIGWEIIDLAIADQPLARCERKAFAAWENATDYRLGFQALDLLRRAVARGRHQRATFTVS